VISNFHNTVAKEAVGENNQINNDNMISVYKIKTKTIISLE
jgi:hypothetical protein